MKIKEKTIPQENKISNLLKKSKPMYNPPLIPITKGWSIVFTVCGVPLLLGMDELFLSTSMQSQFLCHVQ